MGKAKATLDAVGSIADALGGRLKRAADQGMTVDAYHGTADDIPALSKAHRGKNTKAKSAHGAYWFVDDPDVAGGYARMAAEDAPVQRLIDESYAAERRGDWDAAHNLMVQAEELEQSGKLIDAGGQNIIPAKLKGDNLLVIDADGATMSDLPDSQLHEWVKQGKREGYDGLQINNFSDNADWGSYTPATHYAIFDEKNVRSRFAKFLDPTSSNLLAGVKAAAPLTAAAALGYSEDSEAGPISRGGRTLIEAWHGSPHKFDRFSMDKIGTGEGAQAYGHGLYFADSEDVARGYRDDLAPSRGWTPEQIRQHEPGKGGYGDNAWQLYDKETGYLNTELPSFKTQEEAQAFIDNADDALGSLYRTEIDIDPDTLLDWDKPLSEQSEYVRRELGLLDAPYPESSAGVSLRDGERLGDLTGEQYYNRLASMRPNGNRKASATKFLSGGEPRSYRNTDGDFIDKGPNIKGIRYLDGMSRNAGEGSYNYVIFDDSKINIVERGAATPAAMAAAAIPGAVGAYANKRAEQKQTLAQTYAKTNPVNLMAAALLSRVDWSHLDDPARGVYGLVASVKSLFEGQGLSEALQQGGRIASQPVEQTAQQVGDAVYEATDSPLAATAALTATNVWGPM